MTHGNTPAPGSTAPDTKETPEFPVEPIRTLLLEQFDAIDGLLADVHGDTWYTPTSLPGWTVTANGGMNPQPGSFSPGDWCRFTVRDPFLANSIALDGDREYKVLTKRIAAFTVTVPDVTQLPETVELTLVDEWDDEGEA